MLSWDDAAARNLDDKSIREVETWEGAGRGSNVTRTEIGILHKTMVVGVYIDVNCAVCLDSDRFVHG